MLVEPPLTGERTYVHGVDILEALLAGTGAESDIVLVLRTAGGAAIETLDAAPAAGEPGCGEFRYRRAGCAHRVWLRHRPDRPITARRPWDDAELLRGATLGTVVRASRPAARQGRCTGPLPWDWRCSNEATPTTTGRSPRSPAPAGPRPTERSRSRPHRASAGASAASTSRSTAIGSAMS